MLKFVLCAVARSLRSCKNLSPPKGCKAILCTARHALIIVERQPGIICLPWMDCNEMLKYRVVSLPYWITAARIQKFGKYWSLRYFHSFFRKSPLKSWQDRFLYSHFRNCQYGIVCLSSEGHRSGYSSTVRAACDIYKKCMQDFLTSAFNDDMGGWDDSRRMSLPMGEWEKKSKMNPGFGLKVQWEPTSWSCQDLVAFPKKPKLAVNELTEYNGNLYNNYIDDWEY